MSDTEIDAPPRIGRYVDVEPLGRGAMGAVFRAVDPELDRSVAIKVMREVSPEFLARFRREAQAVARLQHPNIVQVYDFGVDEKEQPYFVMELAPGTSLDHLVRRRGRLPAREVVAIVRQAAAALGAAHAAGVVHRDVKPSNLILDAGGRVRVIDFGIARVDAGASQMTAPSTLMGTPSYMAPEQAAGRPVDARSDLYALGLTTFELLAGEPPFFADDVVSLVLKQVQEPLPDLRKRDLVLPEALVRLVERMAAKDPDARPRSAAEVEKALEAIAGALGDGPEGTLPTVAASTGETRQAATAASAAISMPPLGATGQQRRTARLLAFLGAGTAIAVGGVVVARWTGTAPAAPIVPIASPAVVPRAGPLRVAVLRFKNIAAEGHLAPLELGIGETAVGVLAGAAKDVSLIERGDIESSIQEIDRGKDVHFDKLSVAQMGRLSGVEIAIQGAFQQAGGELRVTARFVRVESGEVLDTYTVTRPAGDSFALQDAVAEGLRERLVTLAGKKPRP